MLFEKPHRHEPGEKIEELIRRDRRHRSLRIRRAAARRVPAGGEGGAVVCDEPAAGTAPETEAEAALDVAYPMTFYDSTTEEGSATPIALAGGDRVEANISLHAVPALHLVVEAPAQAGRIRAAPGTSTDDLWHGASGGAVSLWSRCRLRRERRSSAALRRATTRSRQGDPPRVLELDAAGSRQVDAASGAPRSP